MQPIRNSGSKTRQANEGHEDPEGFFFMSFMLFMVKKTVSLSIYIQLMTLTSPWEKPHQGKNDCVYIGLQYLRHGFDKGFHHFHC